jgi:hypothetical protein
VRHDLLHPTLGRMVLMIQRDAQKTGVSRSYSTHDNPLFGLHPVPVDADERIRTSAWRTQSLMLAVALNGLPDDNRGSLSCCVDGVGERTPREARLCHDVMFLGNPERRLTQEVLGASDVHRVPDRPETCGGMPETM